MSTNIKVQRICQYCRNEFTAKTTTTKYCSHKCNSRHYKQRVKEGKIKVSNTETLKIKNIPYKEVNIKEILTVKDVATLLTCSTRTAYRLINNGTIKGVNFGSRMTRVQKSELKKVFEQPRPLKNIIKTDKFKVSDFYTINEVMQKYNVSQGTLQQVIKRNNVPKTKKGRYVYVSKLMINDLLT
ncbi:MAG: hypothetical protein BM557_09840 [Flavobacterium sp. MedPE-SWcel]|uniref:helix-turn-helix domain-containing protein n=1 Tax=uncultured Flavobacterium sp. TaxID=165435 RepID=UPI0009193179|nr:helix-turn-helix domain-containing protein [uncultured Flavobacterium sp.]OIQ16603.1 MAG: hypothetical protein BM557_09840 [Flavobacterium sp. MedPE-SWcel]